MVTVPGFTLLLFAVGLVRAFANRLRDPLAGAALVNFLFFMLLMMTPRAPTYDGVRLFVPAFIFLAILAGFGFDGIMQWILSRYSKESKRLVPRICSLLALAVITAIPLLKVYPFGLEYYNQFIGGVAGANKHGMETTYWWDAVNEYAVKKISKQIPPGASLLCWPSAAKMCEFYQEQGWLSKEVKITYSTDFDYLLLLSRPCPDFEPFFTVHNIPHSDLETIDSKALDGVPLWTLYGRKI
jgi:hypothetical protein